MSTTEVEGLDWSTERFIPGFQSVTGLNVCDVTSASYETLLPLSTLVGLINRPLPRVYLVTSDDDTFWLKEVFAHVSQNVISATNENALDALLSEYHSLVEGLIVYDTNLEDSINVATMLAAQKNALVVSSTQATALQSKYSFPVLDDLSTHGWKTRLHAYHWALQNLRSGCSSRLVAGVGAKNIGLRPFLVATRAFIYDLDSRDYLPSPQTVFTDGLLSERELMRQIFASYSPGAAHVGWFADEGSGVNLTSEKAITVLASDIFTNLEVWTAAQPSAPTLSASTRENEVAPSANTVYVSFTISDGDNLQFCQHHLKNIWRDSARGSFPIGWTLTPSILHASPALAEYYRSSATPNDELIAGPSGAGYMFPSHWPSEHLDAFLHTTGKQMQAMNMTTLEILDTNFLQGSGLPVVSALGARSGMVFTDVRCQDRYVQILRPYGLQGILSGAGSKKVEWKSIDGIPLYQNLGLADSVEGTVAMIKDAANSHSQRPLFLNVYILAWKMSPSDLKAVIEQLGSGYEIVLPKTLLALLGARIA
jgi:hypothetical protein